MIGNRKWNERWGKRLGYLSIAARGVGVREALGQLLISGIQISGIG
jgi:hypothetical protein